MIFFIFGEDFFRINKKSSEIKKAFSEKNPLSEIVVFDFSEKNIALEDFIGSFSAPSLFSSKKLIVAESLLKDLPTENQKLILEKIKKTGLTENADTVLLFKEKGLPKKNLSLYKFLCSNSKMQEFKHLNQNELEKWIELWMSKNFPKIILSKKALEMITSHTGNDLFLLESELEKIGNFKTEGKLLESDIDLMIRSYIQSNIFQAIESLLTKNKRMALSLFHEQLEKGEDAFYILSMYAYQIRTLLKIASEIENGPISYDDMAKKTKLNPYVIKKSLPLAKSVGVKKLAHALQEIYKIDLLSKTGKADLKLCLDRFIASL